MVDVYILKIKVQSLIDRLPDLSKGDTAGRAGEGWCREEGLCSSSGLSLVGARTAVKHNNF